MIIYIEKWEWWSFLKYFAFFQVLFQFYAWIQEGQQITWNLIWIFVIGLLCINANIQEVKERRKSNG